MVIMVMMTLIFLGAVLAMLIIWVRENTYYEPDDHQYNKDLRE